MHLKHIHIEKLNFTLVQTKRHSQSLNPNPNLRPWNTKAMSFLGYHKVIPYTKFEHFGIFQFWVMLQTNKQTDMSILPTLTVVVTDSVGMGNKEQTN